MAAVPAGELEAIAAAHAALMEDARKRGVFVAADPLQATSTATTVRRQGGKVLTLDGPSRRPPSSSRATTSSTARTSTRRSTGPPGCRRLAREAKAASRSARFETDQDGGGAEAGGRRAGSWLTPDRGRDGLPPGGDRIIAGLIRSRAPSTSPRTRCRRLSRRRSCAGGGRRPGTPPRGSRRRRTAGSSMPRAASGRGTANRASLSYEIERARREDEEAESDAPAAEAYPDDRLRLIFTCAIRP